jgi:hypothetical protein
MGFGNDGFDAEGLTEYERRGREKEEMKVVERKARKMLWDMGMITAREYYKLLRNGEEIHPWTDYDDSVSYTHKWESSRMSDYWEHAVDRGALDAPHVPILESYIAAGIVSHLG